MHISSYHSLLFVILFSVLIQFSCDNGSGSGNPINKNAIPGTTVKPGWEWSYKAGYIDSSGIYVGGSEIMNIVSHKEKLYAASGYWLDTANYYYGGSYTAPWAKILRLDAPGGQWECDLQMGPEHLRAELLKSVTFTLNGDGTVLASPVNLLIAGTCTYDWTNMNVQVNIFTRNDVDGSWTKNTVLTLPIPPDYNIEIYSIRTACVYKDSVTGIEKIFLSIGKEGILTGVYDQATNTILWDPVVEIGPLPMRILAIRTVNSSLLFSTEKYIYRRNDGISPTYSIIMDMSDLFTADAQSMVGGIRGMTAMSNPSGPGESILFAYKGYIFRLDPDGSGEYTRNLEVVIDDLMSDYHGQPDSVIFTLAAYNNFIKVTDPSTGEILHIAGFESLSSIYPYLCLPQYPGYGFYPGAMCAIRDSIGNWRLKEVNGRWKNRENPMLVSTRTYALSPFGDGCIYFGGFDGNWIPDGWHETAWIFQTSLENFLSVDP